MTPTPNIGQTVTVTDPRDPLATCAGAVVAITERGALLVLLTKSRLRDADRGDVVSVHPKDWRIRGE